MRVLKNHSTCSDKNCLSCSIPPCTKNKIVKSLATSFCKVAEENLDSKLLKKNKKMGKGKERRLWLLMSGPSKTRGRNGLSYS
jgi:hypothetical protein